MSVLAIGGDELPPFRPSSVLTQAQLVSTATFLLLLATGFYLWAVYRLYRRGDRWPVGRTVVFLLGLAVVALATLSGIGTYDDTLVSVHMVQHMLLAMVAPILLALGAPVTLILRTASPGPRRAVLTVLHSRVASFFTFPLVTFALFVASPFVLYFSGLYRSTLEYSWLHQLVHLHFVLVGCLFFWPLIGIDPLPGRMSYPLRALLMFLSTPFHTVLGLTIMQSSDLLGGDWYPSLGLTWSNPFDDQQLAGGILWAGGEFIAVGMLGALVAQWMRASDREARRIDRALDRAEAEEAAREAEEAVEAATRAAATHAVGSTGSYGSWSPATSLDEALGSPATSVDEALGSPATSVDEALGSPATSVDVEKQSRDIAGRGTTENQR